MLFQNPEPYRGQVNLDSGVSDPVTLAATQSIASAEPSGTILENVVHDDSCATSSGELPVAFRTFLPRL